MTPEPSKIMIRTYRASPLLLLTLGLHLPSTAAAQEAPLAEVDGEREEQARTQAEQPFTQHAAQEREREQRQREEEARRQQDDVRRTRQEAEKQREQVAARAREERERAEREREARDRANNGGGSKPPSTGGGPSRPPQQARVAVGKVTASGDGCPAGSWSASVDPSGTGFDIHTSKLITSITPSQGQSSKTCRLTVSIPRGHAGVSYRISQFAYWGYGYLEPGVTAEFITEYAFANDPASAYKVTSVIPAPLDKEYAVTDDVGSDALWSPCSGGDTFHIDLTLRLTNRGPRGDGTFEISDASALALQTRQCK